MQLLGPADPSPQTPKQRFKSYLLNTAGPVPLVGEALGSGIAQWTNSPPEWGQGWKAYGKRLGSNFAYNAVRQTISYAAASAFHEDYRYFAAPEPGPWRRVRHALIYTFTARHSDGRDRFSVASVAGVVGASGIASIWGPRSWQGAGNIAENAGISFASTAGLNVVREFLPDILGRPRK